MNFRLEPTSASDPASTLFGRGNIAAHSHFGYLHVGLHRRQVKASQLSAPLDWLFFIFRTTQCPIVIVKTSCRSSFRPSLTLVHVIRPMSDVPVLPVICLPTCRHCLVSTRFVARSFDKNILGTVQNRNIPLPIHKSKQ